MVYALVNTMSQTETVLGHLVSCHGTLLDARQADQRLQKQAKLIGGQGSRMPTVIVGLKKRPLGTAVERASVVDENPK